MDNWLKKVEEMKKLRQATESNILTKSATLNTTTLNTTTSNINTTIKPSSKSTDFINKTSNNKNNNDSNTSNKINNTNIIKSNYNTLPSGTNINKVITETPKPSSSIVTSNSDNLGSSLYKIKYEQEVKKRTELEQECNAKNKEIQKLKEELIKLKKLGSTTTGTTPSSPTSNMPKRATKMFSKRQTQRMSIQVVGALDDILKQVGGVDKRIRAAEAARMQAEDKLMDIAIAKLEVDEVIQKVDSVLKKIIDQIDHFSNAQIKEMLQKIRTQTASEEEGGGGKAACRFSIIVPQGGLRFDEMENIPKPPPPTTTTPRSRIGNIGSGNNNTDSRLSLLEQIRRGTPLRNIDVTKLKEEQQKFRVQAKEEIGNMKSLEEVLRDALSTRMNDMNLYEDEEEEDFWEE